MGRSGKVCAPASMVTEAIEQQTNETAIRKVLVNYLAEIASDGDDSLLTIANKLRSKCTLDNWKTCKQ